VLLYSYFFSTPIPPCKGRSSQLLSARCSVLCPPHPPAPFLSRLPRDAAVLELVRFTVSEGPMALASNMTLVQVLVPSIMELRPRFCAAIKVSTRPAQPCWLACGVSMKRPLSGGSKPPGFLPGHSSN